MSPRTYIIGYCKEMTKIAHDHKLLIHCFHRSLIGITLEWYIQLDSFLVKSWKDLAGAIIN